MDQREMEQSSESLDRTEDKSGDSSNDNLSCTTNQNGAYGNESSLAVIISYDYEMVISMDASLDLAVDSLEKSIVDVLIPSFFSDCSNDYEETLHRKLQDVEVVGIDSFPPDTEQGTCDTIVSNTTLSYCFNMIGSLSIYLNDDFIYNELDRRRSLSHYRDVISSSRSIIRKGMESDLFLSKTSNNILQLSYIDDEEEKEAVDALTMNNNLRVSNEMNQVDRQIYYEREYEMQNARLKASGPSTSSFSSNGTPIFAALGVLAIILLTAGVTLLKKEIRLEESTTDRQKAEECTADAFEDDASPMSIKETEHDSI